MAVYYILILLWYRFWLIGKKAQWPYLRVIMWIPQSKVLLYLLWMMMNSSDFYTKSSRWHIAPHSQLPDAHIAHLFRSSCKCWLLIVVHQCRARIRSSSTTLSWFLILGQKYHFFSALQVKTQSSPNTLIQVQIKAQEIHRARHHGDKCVFMLNGSCLSPEQLWN